MSLDRDEQTALYQRYLERCNQHRFDELGEFVAENVIGSTERLANYISGCLEVVVAFPDYRWNVQHIVVDGPWLAARLWGLGTHTGTFRGVLPTGRKIQVQELVQYRFADGKIAECWGDLHTNLRDQLISGS